VSKQCGQPVKAKAFWFRASDGNILNGAMLGSGDRGIVLVHGYPGSLCDMLGLGWLMANRGFRVLAFDVRGYGLSPRAQDPKAINHVTADIAGAADELRERGAKKVFLVGWSFGGTAVAAAAPELDPPADGVVDISGPATLEFAFPGTHDLNGLIRARGLKSPFLYLVARGDSRIVLAEARELMRRAPSQDKRLFLYRGRYHAGELLFGAPFGLRVQRTMFDFLQTR
jgi:pimeloyl-ACP methyl ester carboxylesterase